MFPTQRKRNTPDELDAERQANAASQPGIFRAAGDVTDVEPKNAPEGDASGGDTAGPQAPYLTPRDTYIAPREGEAPEPSYKINLFKGDPVVEADAPQDEQVRVRHLILMECLEEEAERQAEERHQAQIDHEYYDHQQWTAEEARALMERGQAPLVYNESRAAIDWLAGTERRLRKDYKIRPRNKGEDAIADIKTKVFKYVDDVNLATWHRSRAFKQTAISGLGWLEEGINLDPERELVYSGSEDWRRVYRDSRGKEFDQSDWRYIHRRKIIDLDYAVALMPGLANHLNSVAGRWSGDNEDEGDQVWYLGQRLMSAHAAGWMLGEDGLFGGDYTVRRMGYSAYDRGRRNSVELIETYYRVPERVKVFAHGPLYRKIYNPADPAHQQAMNDKLPFYESVKWCMRVMVGTKYQPGWDGPSPFRHGQFTLIPMFGYRRGRDGQAYGTMRGMRDPQDDLNKRRSKALHILSSNKFAIKEGAADDIEDLRAEAARADGLLVLDDVNNIKELKPSGEVAQNLEMAESDRIAIRNAGGVTGDNLGQDSNAVSGKAIIAKQDQGSLTSFELFDNFYLSFKLAGQRRLSNIEQFCNQPWTIRIDPDAAGIPEWHEVNQFDPRTGQYLNDITATQADFIIDQQDYRATLAQAAMQSMFDLLGQIANFAPQVVVSVLDLVVDSSDVPMKEEWVRRIRQINGQGDPSKPPTPEQIAAQQKQQQMQDAMAQANLGLAQGKVQELQAKITSANAEKVLKSLQSLLFAIEGAASIATIPGVAAAADGLAKAAGFQDATPATPIIATPASVQPAPATSDASMPKLGGAPVAVAQPTPNAAPGAAVPPQGA